MTLYAAGDFWCAVSQEQGPDSTVKDMETATLGRRKGAESRLDGAKSGHLCRHLVACVFHVDFQK
jgi:hypothetical protein